MSDVTEKEVDKKLVAPEPEHCPGVGSNDAGTASACEGCPNQKICVSAQPAAIDPDVALIAQRLANVKHKMLILSGKGGVGTNYAQVLLP